MTELPLGSFIDARHRIDGVIGGGAHARIYAATDTQSDRRVAVKVLTAPEDPARRQRFDRELRAVARLRDPHTVTLFDHGVLSDGRPYLVFEYVDGADLQAALRSRANAFDPSTVRHLLEQLLESLGEAHALGIIHRDIRPGNLQVFEYQGDPWRLKVLDFGIGKQTGDDRLTVTGERLGSPRYASPEQLRGEPAGPASDLYSAGLVALELLVGPGLTREQLEASRAKLALADPLQSTIARLTELDVARRLHSAPAAIAALQREPTAPGPEVRVAPGPRVRTATEQHVRAPSRSLAPIPPPPSRPQNPATNPRRRNAALVVALIGALVAIALIVQQTTRDPESAPNAQVVPHRNNPLAATPTDTKATTSGQPDRGQPAAAATPQADAAQLCEPAPFVGLGKLADGDVLTPASLDAYIPTSYTTERHYPLVAIFHQNNDDPREFLVAGGFPDLAEEHEFIALAPAHADLMKPWAGEEGEQIATRALNAARKQLCVDNDRIFLVGHGEGGGLVRRLACQGWVRAAALSAHRNSTANLACPKEEPIPTILLAPTRSGHVPFKGGESCRGNPKAAVAQVERKRREWHRCRGSRSLSFRHEESRCFEWACDVPLESCHVDGGQPWPGLAPRKTDDLVQIFPLGTKKGCGDGPTPDFPSAGRVWDFFQRSASDSD